MTLAFSVKNLINCVQNKSVLWDLQADSSEEDKVCSDVKLPVIFVFLTGNNDIDSLLCRAYFVLGYDCKVSLHPDCSNKYAHANAVSVAQQTTISSSSTIMLQIGPS